MMLCRLRQRRITNSAKCGDVFVVCDAGGGTVVSSPLGESGLPLKRKLQDLISYEVTQINPIKIKECVEGSGMRHLFSLFTSSWIT
jgi:hypothetical protein